MLITIGTCLYSLGFLFVCFLIKYASLTLMISMLFGAIITLGS